MKYKPFITTLIIIFTLVVMETSISSYSYLKVKNAHRCVELVAMGWQKGQDLYVNDPIKYEWADRNNDGYACNSYKP